MIVKRGKRTYLYRSARVDGQPRREYVCCDPTGLGLVEALQASHDAMRERRRRFRAARREAFRAEAATLGGWDQEIGRAVAGAVGSARSCLESLGYHRAQRWRWRKKRGATMTGELTKSEGQGAAPAPLGGPIKPGHLGTITISLLMTIAKGIEVEGGPEAAQRFVLGEVEGHARFLSGPATSPVEWELCVTAAIVHFELRAAEARVATLRARGADEGQRLELHDRRVDRLRRRYTQLVRALADVRRLAGPTLNATLVSIGQMTLKSGKPRKRTQTAPTN